MFALQSGDSAETISRKKDCMKAAQEKWPFLTHFDLSTIKTKGQLSAMVKTRAHISPEQAQRDVEAWMQGNQFSPASPAAEPRQEPSA